MRNIAFHTRYGQFIYPVMPLALQYTPVTFKPYISDCWQPHWDHFAGWYLDDMRKISTNTMVNKMQVTTALKGLWEHGVYSNMNKGYFGV